jgi:hypothetical protein
MAGMEEGRPQKKKKNEKGEGRRRNGALHFAF